MRKKGKERERKFVEYENERERKRERERVCRNNVIESRRMRGTVVGNYFQN